jgi:hypothetical protein
MLWAHISGTYTFQLRMLWLPLTSERLEHCNEIMHADIVICVDGILNARCYSLAGFQVSTAAVARNGWNNTVDEDLVLFAVTNGSRGLS